MTFPRFSILVTVYNTAKYCEDCFNSIIAQSYTDFEAVVIDDGSTDESSRICDSFAEKDSRFRVYHTSNQGVLLARKLAFDKSRGRYILNVDSDDLLNCNLLQTVSSEFEKSDCDMVIFDYKTITPDGTENITGLFVESKIFMPDNKSEFFKLLLSGSINSLAIKCYSRELADIPLNYNRFHALSHSEDLLQSTYIIGNSHETVCIPDALYIYRLGVGATQKFDRDAIYNYSDALDEIKAYIERLGLFTDENKREFHNMCRRTLSNYIRLLSASGISAGECAQILKESASANMFVTALEGKYDEFYSKNINLRYSLLRKKMYFPLILLQRQTLGR